MGREEAGSMVHHTTDFPISNFWASWLRGFLEPRYLKHHGVFNCIVVRSGMQGWGRAQGFGGRGYFAEAAQKQLEVTAREGDGFI